MEYAFGAGFLYCPLHLGNSSPITGSGYKDSKVVEFASRIWQHKRICEIAMYMGFPVPACI